MAKQLLIKSKNSNKKKKMTEYKKTRKQLRGIRGKQENVFNTKKREREIIELKNCKNYRMKGER